MELSEKMIHSRDIILNSSAFSNIKLLSISGSIGRKEKSIDDRNLNDVDFFVVAEKCDYYNKKLAEDELNKLFETKFTDITFMKENKIINVLSRKKISQFLFDTLKGQITLYYDHEFYNEFETFTKRHYEVEYKSALIVFFTRLWSMIGPFGIEKYDFFIRNNKLAIYQVQKAISAIIDAILIYEKSYKSPNKEIKLNDFKETSFYEDNYKLASHVIDIYMDLNESETMTIEIYQNVLKLYLKCRDHLFAKKSLFEIICIMDKKYIIKRILFKSKAKVILQYIERYNILLVINDFISGNLRNDEAKELGVIMDRISKEAFGGISDD